MSIFRTIAMFIYLFGYMIVHYGVLRRAERALAAGDTQLVEELVNKHIPHWSRGILKVTGVSLSVEGLENIPKDTPCVFVGNHRSYYDIPLLLASLDKPHGILAKEELEKIPLLNRWMKLLGCVFVQRDDLRASVRALNDATSIVESGKSFVIFPEGTRYKGEEGGAGEFKAGAFRIAVKTGAPVVPVAITGARALRQATKLGVIVHMIGGTLGLIIMLVLGYLGSTELLTPVNILLYQLIWAVPGLLVTEWTRIV